MSFWRHYVVFMEFNFCVCDKTAYIHFYHIYSGKVQSTTDGKSAPLTKSSYKWSLEEVGSRARSERVSKFYGQFAEKADKLGISHACFAAYLGYR